MSAECWNFTTPIQGPSEKSFRSLFLLVETKKMPKWKEQTLFERVTWLWGEKDGPYARLEDARDIIVQYFRPDLGVDYDESADMLMLGGCIYEGSGPWVARTASTAFQGNTVSKKLDWFRYKFSDKRLEGIDQLDEFTQNMKDHMASVYQDGNWYDVQRQFTLDGWTTGSPVMFIEEDPDTNLVMVILVHYKTYRLFYDRYNRSEGIILKDTEWTAKKCFDKFAPGRTMAERMKKAEEIFTVGTYNLMKQGQWEDRVTIWRAVFKATDPMWGDDFKAPPGGKLYYDAYFEDTVTLDKQNEPLMTSGYNSKPFVQWDFDKKTWESSSRTPAFEAIFDNYSNNQTFKLYLDSLQMKVRPAMAALQEMENRLEFDTEGLTLMNRNEWNFRPEPIQTVGDIQLLAETSEIFKKALNRWFSLDTFRMFTNLSQESRQDFRVLQLAEMAGERITELLPTIEAHEHYLSEVDLRVRDIEMRAGRGPFNRLEMENVLDIIEFALGEDGSRFAQVSPVFMGTLRQTQQMQQKLKPISTGMSVLAEIGQAMQDPGYVRRMVKGYEVGDEGIRAVNFPQKLIVEKEAYDTQLEAEQQAVAQKAQFDRAVELMKAGKVNLQGETADSSPVKQLTGAA